MALALFRVDGCFDTLNGRAIAAQFIIGPFHFAYSLVFEDIKALLGYTDKYIL